MNTVSLEASRKPLSGKYKDRRILKDRRINQGRRSMIRFDKNGGDRRSGNARRSTDVGFRQEPEED